MFFLLRWNVLVTFAIFAKFAAFSRLSFSSFFMIVCFAKVVVFVIFSISVIKFSKHCWWSPCYFYEFAILVEFVILALIYYFFYTSLQAFSMKPFLLKLWQSKFLLKLAILVELFSLAIFAISVRHFCKQFPYTFISLLKLRKKKCFNKFLGQSAILDISG